MGILQSTQLQILTLTFSGKNQSPFEFYTEARRKEQETLDEAFTRILKQQLKMTELEFKNYSWELGVIDKCLQKGRYSVLYEHNICTIEDRLEDGRTGLRLVNREEFKAKWEEAFDRVIQEAPTALYNSFKLNKITEIEKLNCCILDFVCYLAVLEWIFKSNYEEKLKRSTPNDVQDFQNYLRSIHTSADQSQQSKLQKLKRFVELHDTDVLFLQQVTLEGIQIARKKLDIYEVVCQSGCAILYRKSRFHELTRNLQLQEKALKHFVVQNEIAICCISHVLFISAHMTSRKQNEEQCLQFLQLLIAFEKQNPSIKIVCGINSNSFIQESLLYLFPDKEQIKTSQKKRTFLQAQFNKAQHVMEEVKDHLLSTERLFDCQIAKVDDTPVTTTSYLPTSGHPFTNFMLVGNVRV